MPHTEVKKPKKVLQGILKARIYTNFIPFAMITGVLTVLLTHPRLEQQAQAFRMHHKVA